MYTLVHLLVQISLYYFVHIFISCNKVLILITITKSFDGGLFVFEFIFDFYPE